MRRSTPYSSHIFQQPWWLDAVAPNQWDETVVTRGQEVVARLPFVIRKKYGMTAITMPPLTQHLGPWMRNSSAKYAHRLSEQKEILTELIELLPRFDMFRMNFSPEVTNWLPFYWAGYDQSTRYTYRLERTDEINAIWSQLRENVRRQVRKASRSLEVRDDLSLETFLRLNRQTFERQGIDTPYSADTVIRLDEACSYFNARKMLFAVDAHGQVHAAIYLVWDQHSIYYLMGGSDPELRSSGATSLLLWSAIQEASNEGKAFDFEGSMIEPIERLFLSFGAHQTPYFQISKMSRRLGLISAGIELVRAVVHMGK